MIPGEINFERLLDARSFFERNGYTYVESPWVVAAEVMNITRPTSVTAIKKDSFVASGEQSLLQMIADRQLTEGLWQTLTPCYRRLDGDRNDEIHFSQFYKLELCWYKGMVQPAPALVQVMIGQVLNWLNLFQVTTRVVGYDDEERGGCTTEAAADIEIYVGEDKWVEYGSYGIRHNENLGYWIYGTGQPEPRFEWLIRNCKDLPK